jgi:hypothetical protein
MPVGVEVQLAKAGSPPDKDGTTIRLAVTTATMPPRTVTLRAVHPVLFT